MQHMTKRLEGKFSSVAELRFISSIACLAMDKSSPVSTTSAGREPGKGISTTDYRDNADGNGLIREIRSWLLLTREHSCKFVSH